MRRVLRWIGFFVGGLVVVVVIGLAFVYVITSSRMSREYEVVSAPISIRTDSISIQRGKHLAIAISQCANCHGDNLAGKVFVDNPVMGRIYSANLTRGKGGIGGSYSDADYVRAIRYGLNRKNRPLASMPVDAFHPMSDEDLAV